MLIAAPASANIWCSGKLAGVYITSSGDVVINGSWRNDWTRICNLNAGEVSAVTCSMWASYAATAKKDSLNVKVAYTAGLTSCSTIGTYETSPIPYYLMLDV
ncbi:hypothetical protein M2404_001091 [Rheinheimera pacifica]|uniref:hypothetical protein n=1 Tax=Rheinheimera pacifica TaxID=173990 RepID=UPI002169A2EE|nr:hypothetical protein [Rheinheimera pacifica]MCS4306766.1 hypothetical protein [Rheinheimera pacifica]